MELPSRSLQQGWLQSLQPPSACCSIITSTGGGSADNSDFMGFSAQNQINGIAFTPPEVMSVKNRLKLVEEEMASLSGIKSEESKIDLIESMLALRAMKNWRFEVRFRVSLTSRATVTAASKDEACDIVCDECFGDWKNLVISPQDLEILEVTEVRA